MKRTTTIQHPEAFGNYYCRRVFFDTFLSKMPSMGLSHISTISDTSVIWVSCSFTGKERDEETGFGYFGARYMDHELTTMWLSVDPMADKYPSISPYAYCAWNPVKLVDPDGRDIWEISRKGEIIWVQKSEKTELYSLDNKSKRTGAFIELSNDDLLKQLSTPKRLVRTEDAVGRVTWRGASRTALSTNKKDIVILFDFAAKNTKVEWGVYSFSKDRSHKYGIGTFQKDNLSPSAGEFQDTKGWSVTSLIHSHPNPQNHADEISSLYGDSSVARSCQYPYYVYMSHSQNLYQINNKSGKENLIGRMNSYTHLFKYIR